MNGFARLAALALVAVVAVGGTLYLLRPAGGPGGPSITPTDTPLVTTTPSRAPSPTPELLTPSPLQGRATDFPVAFDYTLPTGADLVVSPDSNWYQFRHRNPNGDVPAWDHTISVRSIAGGRQDPCSETSSTRPLADPAAFVEYFRSIPTVTVSDVTPATVGGYGAVTVTIAFADPTPACEDVWLWAEDGSITQLGGREPKRLTLFDVEGHHYVINGPVPSDPWYPVAQAFVSSITFAAAGPSPTP